MINVNQMTAAFAKMPDAALKQYATMHKNDPYTVALAMSESNRRKQVRDSAQGQAAQQPTVVDQELAQMDAPPPQAPQAPQGQAQAMPENTGIGTLPQQPMQMAEGGIVAFDKGGLTQAEETARRSREWEKYKADMQSRPQTDPLGLYGAYTGAKNFLSSMTEDPRLSWNIQKMQDASAEAAKNTPAYDEKAMDASTAAAFMDASARPLVETAPPTTAPAVPPVVTPTGAPGTGGAPRAAAPAAPTKDFLTLQREAEARYGPAVDVHRAEREDITNEAVRGREEGLAKLKADQEAESAGMFKGREERLGKREAELGKQKDTNTGMAFLEAGLAMMQARGPGLAGIAQGAGVGLKQYASGIKDIKAAQEKLDESRDRMEELRQNQSSMNKREVRAEERSIKDLVVQGKRDYLAGAEKATGEKKADVRAIVTSNMAVSEADKTRATQLQAAGIAAAPGLARNKILAEAQGDQAKARTEYGKLQTKVMSELGKDASYTLEQDPVKKTALYNNALRAALQNNPFLSSYAAGIGFSTAPAGSGTVRELDAD